MSYVKTVDLTADTEQEITVEGGNHVKIWNRSAETVYVSAKSGVVPDADGVKAILPNNSAVLRNVGDERTGKFYAKSSGNAKIEIETAVAVGDFFKSGNSGGGGDSSDLAPAVAANTAAIAVLNGTGNGSVTKTVTDKIAEVVADAPEDFDTLKEMSDWISEHEDSAADMNSAIFDNADAIETLNGDVSTEGSVLKSIKDNVTKSLSTGNGKIEVCGEEMTVYDDTEIKAEIDEADERLTSLETKMTSIEDSELSGAKTMMDYPAGYTLQEFAEKLLGSYGYLKYYVGSFIKRTDTGLLGSQSGIFHIDTRNIYNINIIFYPTVRADTGVFYKCVKTGDTWSSWYKYVGEAV